MQDQHPKSLVTTDQKQECMYPADITQERRVHPAQENLHTDHPVQEDHHSDHHLVEDHHTNQAQEDHHIGHHLVEDHHQEALQEEENLHHRITSIKEATRNTIRHMQNHIQNIISE